MYIAGNRGVWVVADIYYLEMSAWTCFVEVNSADSNKDQSHAWSDHPHFNLLKPSYFVVHQSILVLCCRTRYCPIWELRLCNWTIFVLEAEYLNKSCQKPKAGDPPRQREAAEA